MQEIKIYRCRHCGNIVVHLYDSGMPVACCGEDMELLRPDDESASIEKHIPVIEHVGNKVVVSVGKQIHPMTRDHYIEWIVVQWKDGFQVHYLTPGEAPVFETCVCSGITPVAAYAYCNIHGLWVTQV